jgi:hypothetical protein
MHGPDPNSTLHGQLRRNAAEPRDVYLTDDPDEAAVLLDKAITGCTTDDVLEIQSLGRTLAAWRTEILAHQHRREQRTDRRPEPLRQESQALRTRLPILRELPTPRAPPYRRCHLADTAPPAAHQNPVPPTQTRRAPYHAHGPRRDLVAGGW